MITDADVLSIFKVIFVICAAIGLAVIAFKLLVLLFALVAVGISSLF